MSAAAVSTTPVEQLTPEQIEAELTDLVGMSMQRLRDVESSPDRDMIVEGWKSLDWAVQPDKSARVVALMGALGGLAGVVAGIAGAVSGVKGAV